MPAKDAQIKTMIEQVIGCSRKGRNKVICLVKKKYPHISGSKIRRVYELEGFSLYLVDTYDTIFHLMAADDEYPDMRYRIILS
ncbi:hypothetical protein [Cyclobacterium jeungdonense]|uniref:Uncharacterized protein n=1 Tax=Cyclobacterium jeungdonense TaxID=708087 RepID=A0ABT8C7U8_9BACT|nr:hypothetical protein [Cyclobacterium jeungdonense]MDN3688855.1 hypothetical protein [Cyclobacterium jeungdonense]